MLPIGGIASGRVSVQPVKQACLPCKYKQFSRLCVSWHPVEQMILTIILLFSTHGLAWTESHFQLRVTTTSRNSFHGCLMWSTQFLQPPPSPNGQNVFLSCKVLTFYIPLPSLPSQKDGLLLCPSTLIVHVFDRLITGGKTVYKYFSKYLEQIWLRWTNIVHLDAIISRPGQSQGLLYKHLCHSFSHPLVKISLRRRHAQTVQDCASSHRIN